MNKIKNLTVLMMSCLLMSCANNNPKFTEFKEEKDLITNLSFDNTIIPGSFYSVDSLFKDDIYMYEFSKPKEEYYVGYISSSYKKEITYQFPTLLLGEGNRYAVANKKLDMYKFSYVNKVADIFDKIDDYEIDLILRRKEVKIVKNITKNILFNKKGYIYYPMFCETKTKEVPAQYKNNNYYFQNYLAGTFIGSSQEIILDENHNNLYGYSYAKGGAFVNSLYPAQYVDNKLYFASQINSKDLKTGNIIEYYYDNSKDVDHQIIKYGTHIDEFKAAEAKNLKDQNFANLYNESPKYEANYRWFDYAKLLGV